MWSLSQTGFFPFDHASVALMQYCKWADCQKSAYIATVLCKCCNWLVATHGKLWRWHWQLACWQGVQADCWFSPAGLWAYHMTDSVLLDCEHTTWQPAGVLVCEVTSGAHPCSHIQVQAIWFYSDRIRASWCKRQTTCIFYCLLKLCLLLQSAQWPQCLPKAETAPGTAALSTQEYHPTYCQF